MNSEKTLNPPRILVVDDNPINVQLVGSILSEEGYIVEFASGGQEAMDWISSLSFDLILLDVIMPGKSGFQVCREIRNLASYASVPVVFLSGKNDEETIQEGNKAGGTDYLFKPIGIDELLHCVSRHLSMNGQNSAQGSGLVI